MYRTCVSKTSPGVYGIDRPSYAVQRHPTNPLPSPAFPCSPGRALCQPFHRSRGQMRSVMIGLEPPKTILRVDHQGQSSTLTMRTWTALVTKKTISCTMRIGKRAMHIVRRAFWLGPTCRTMVLRKRLANPSRSYRPCKMMKVPRRLGWDYDDARHGTSTCPNGSWPVLYRFLHLII
ncbi:hypothetical protein CLU79DRAFT_765830 [Phycomyces nitens]|nr:hypothetical protein CLU79DRAFT_765830 [Phycomyces nitens]